MLVRTDVARGGGNVVAAQIVKMNVLATNHGVFHGADGCTVFEDAGVRRKGAAGELVPAWVDELLERAVKKLEDEVERAGGVDNITEENLPEAHIRGDVNTPYKCIGAAVFTMQRAGFARVGFISQPNLVVNQ